MPAADSSALLVDLYELTMGESYLAQGLDNRPATFELTCRTLPSGWGYLLAAGLDDVLTYLEELRFTPGDIAFLETTGLFTPRFLERLSGLRFSGSVRALPEGTAVFPGEPILELTAPLLEAQLVETAVLNKVHFPTLIASKAARCVDAARGRRLVEFGLRRVHGAEAGLKAARAAYLAGCDATSNVLAGSEYGIPLAGTMAHSYVESFDDESAAFRAFTDSYPDGSTLLIDTYDTVQGARRAATVGRALAGLAPLELDSAEADGTQSDHASLEPAVESRTGSPMPEGDARDRGRRLGAVRIDSGDLDALSRRVRVVMDGAGLPDVAIFASGNLDELAIDRLVETDAPIDGFGVGTRLGTSAGSPYLEVAYKLVVFDGRPVQKLSPGKATLPGSKQVWRSSRDGHFSGDLVSLADEPGPPGAAALLQPVLREGARLDARTGPAALGAARTRAAAERAALPDEVRALEQPIRLPGRVEQSSDRPRSPGA